MELSKYVEELSFEEISKRSRDIGTRNSPNYEQKRGCRGSSELRWPSNKNIDP
jgi:hypothetical protein